MEPNVFVSYIKVVLARGNYYTSKAFTTEALAQQFTDMLQAAILADVPAIEVKGKVLILRLNAMILPTDDAEPSMEDVVVRSVQNIISFTKSIV